MKSLLKRRKARAAYKRVVKTSKPGSGKRFAALTKSISLGKRVRNPAAVAASIGRKKYHAGFQKMSARGRKRKTRRFV